MFNHQLIIQRFWKKLTTISVIVRRRRPERSGAQSKGKATKQSLLARRLLRRGEHPPRNDGLLLFLCGLLLTACSALARPTLGTATPPPPTATPILSPTVVWFPPSETPVLRAVTSPTAPPDWRPGLGDAIKVDSFTDDAVWDIYKSDDGTASLFDGRLALSAAPNVYLTSLNKKLVLTDFYVEVTASLNICRGADEYGILVRAIPTAAYRFALTCDGQVHAERVAREERLVLESPFRSGDAPRGAPAEVRIGVWVLKGELRFFLNGHYQFSVTDSNLPSGSIGFFVHAAGATSTAVSFTDLVINKLNYSPIGTPKP